MELLERLINAHGVSGNENQIRDVIREEITPLVDEVWTDSSGNLVAREGSGEPRFMLSAHMDEIGLMVREITSNGLLLCAGVGGVNPMAMIGTRVTVENTDETVHGLVTTRDISCGYDVEDLPAVDDLLVDTGVPRDELVRLGVTVGSFLEPAKEINWLVHGNMISGKALDNRVGCYVLIEVARKLQGSPYGIYFTFTVQEEIGLYGAKTSAFAIRPDWAVVVDVTPAADLSEDADTKSTTISLGKGPCLLHMDESFIADARLNRVIQSVAKKAGIGLQHEVSSFGTTDATNISTVRRGVPSSTLSVPVRNVHSTLEIADRRDVDAVIKVLTNMLRRPPKELMRKPPRTRRARRTTKAQVKTAGKKKRKKKKSARMSKALARKKAAGAKRAKPVKKKKSKKAAAGRKKTAKAKAKPKRKAKSKAKPKRRRKSNRTTTGRPRKRVRPKPKARKARSGRKKKGR
ncbi:MAG: M42 family metallopeptidase [Planctomycetota bacterium]|jgi:endoglucanase